MKDTKCITPMKAKTRPNTWKPSPAKKPVKTAYRKQGR